MPNSPQPAPPAPSPPPAAPGRSGRVRAGRAGVVAAERIQQIGGRTGRLVHAEHIPARRGHAVPWPGWVPGELTSALAASGVTQPWAHQAAMAELAWAGRNVIMATPAASGKSLGYLLPALSAALAGGTALYLAPTRALAADQWQAVQALRLRGAHAVAMDGDTPASAREWARCHASYLLTTPDLLHQYLLPRHARWQGFFRRLRYVIIDECHGYRGVFGSHVAQVLRRLSRVAAHHAGAPGPAGRPGPVFLLASATISEPATCARLLTGQDADEITESAAPHGPVTVCLWEPPLTTARGEAGAPVRRAATAEAASLLADLVAAGAPVLAFTRSRRGAELVALSARHHLAASGAGEKAGQVAAYRSGYLAGDRRDLEAGLRSGAITGLAATSALELGVSYPGLDAVLMAGWPGSRAAFWQQAGRAGRSGRAAVAVLIARDDPLDTYLVHHPQALLAEPVEATVLDPANPYVLGPHLCAAAAELPLSPADLARFGPGAGAVAEELVASGMLRQRGERLCWTRRGPAVSLRGPGDHEVRIVEEETGRLLGTVDGPSAQLLVHDGAVYLHQGETYLVRKLDLPGRVALVTATSCGYTTSAREVTAIEVAAELSRAALPGATVSFGEVNVVRQVVSFSRRSLETGQPLGEVPLAAPPRTLRTRAVWWTLPAARRARLAAAGVDLAGAAHAAGHTAIGLLPLFAACDRWDIGGVSADLHPATGLLTVFVYDGHEGGAGFAERGFGVAAGWLAATAQAIASCECQGGCPSCIQSPTCGNANQPLSKDGAVRLLRTVLGAQSGLRGGREIRRPPPGGRAGVAARHVPRGGTHRHPQRPDALAPER